MMSVATATSATRTTRGRATRLLLAGGVIGPPLFTLVYLVEGATRPGYDAWQQTVSALSLGEQGWLQVASFLVCGLLSLGFAAGSRVALRGGPGATWGPRVLAIFGLGLIVAGIFATDPAQGYPPGTPLGPSVVTTVHGTVHFLLGGLPVFAAMPAACGILARRFAATRAWGWVWYSVGSGILALTCFVAFAVLGVRGGPAGLLERCSLVVGLAWLTALAVRLLRATDAPGGASRDLSV
ncbi:MAG TPA: DUF998 domain-containing protein [Thermomicrobiales bacterium]|nr:DUF998 domain-containing protein [Thermomicrobiales bacterium]